MMMCALDTETQGFGPNDRITEIGAIVFNPRTFERLGAVNTLIWDETYHPQTEEIIEITGITDVMLRDGIDFVSALMALDEIIGKAGGISHFVAHNAPFDRGVFHKELKRSREQIPEAIFDKYLEVPWLCSYKDIKHPEKFKSRKLSHLALDYGIAVDPAKLHRATADCELMLDMIKASGTDMSAMAGRASIPDVIIRAVVPSPFGAGSDGGKGKDKAKSLGYGWQKAHGTDGPTVKNAWLKKVKQDEIEKEKEALGYEVRVIEG